MSLILLSKTKNISSGDKNESHYIMINTEELFRIYNFPTIDGYLASISNDEGEAISKAESTLMEIKFNIEKKVHELNYRKLKREFSFSLKTAGDDDLHDYSTPEVGKFLNRTPSAVRCYIRDGRLKAYQTLNGDFRVTKEALEEFLNTLRTSGRVN
jgi:hypothetical protein